MKAAIAKVLLCYLLCLPAAGSASDNVVPPKLEGWYLVWHDEFDGDKVDPKKWRVEDAALVKNDELQYYSPQDVYVHDGILTLKSEKRKMGDRDYCSGLVETKGKFSVQYGRVEVRAKLPGTQGMWPAHWMLADSGDWPPEIDIMELVGRDPNVIHMTNHYGRYPGNRWDWKNYTGPDYTKDFHVFAIEWEPQEIRWYIDGTQQFSVKSNMPRELMFIILNTAVGGIMPGNPDATTVFPQYHDIDYVRVYVKETPGEYFLTTGTDNGRIIIDPKEIRYKAGSKVKITAEPDIGYKFKGWSGDITAPENPAVITMDGYRNITADFVVDPDAPQLLSRGKPAFASSAENGSLSAENAFDGKKDTRWSSEFSDPQWIYVDLEKVCQIEAIRLVWESSYARAFKIEVSDDAKEWKAIYETDKGTGKVLEIRDLDASGRYVRMSGTVRKNQYGYSLWEFEVFGRSQKKLVILHNPAGKAPF